jgi:DNA topoisomerase III
MPARRCRCRQAGGGRRDRRCVRCRRAHYRQAEGRRCGWRASGAWCRCRQRRCSLSADACNEAVCRQPRPAEGIKPPPGYKTSISICCKFLNEHAPKKAEGETAGKLAPKPASPAQWLYAKKIAQGKGLVIPEEAKASSAAMSAWIDSNRGTKRRKRGRKTAYMPPGSAAPQSAGRTKRSRKRKAGTDAAPPTPAHSNSVIGTPLRIPYGNKDVAMRLGARYGSAGWYAPPGVDLAAFGERGWL